MNPLHLFHSRYVCSLVRVIVSTAALGLWSASIGAHAAPPIDDYWSRRSQLDQTHADRLTSLAAKCKELDLEAQANVTSDWFIHRDPRRQYIFLPSESDPTQPADDAPKIVRQWHAKFLEYRRQHAAALFQLVERELHANRPTRAYQLLHEVLHENPDHEQARGILGYRRVSGRWRKPTGLIKARQGRVSNPTLGFSAGQHWIIESGHFSITTNHSEEAGRRLVGQLEELHTVWQQLFFRCWSSRAVLDRRFEGKSTTSRSLKRHKVVLFQDRQQYLDHLTPLERLIEVTVGVYLEPRKSAYFYVGEESKEHIWFHEIVHQLFSETGRVPAGVGLNNNFWIVEGVALYMESLRRMEHYYTVGGIDADRLQYARYRALNEEYYVPLDQLGALGRRALQEHENIRPLYSQSAGLAGFLMDYKRGVYRPAMVDYLRTIYQGRDRAGTLANVAGVPLTELDKQYHEFLNVSDDDLAFLASMPVARNLSLGRTAVTDAGMRHLAGPTQLEWVDLAHTQVGDSGLANLKASEDLNHLIAAHTKITDTALKTIRSFRNLEILDLMGTSISDAGLADLASLTKFKELWLGGTRISDTGVQTVGSFRNLESLDLTATNITDNGLVHLASLTKLKVLWLGGTRISDAGLVHLEGLKNLETLDIRKTNVTANGWNRLKRALPSLKE